MKTKLQLNCDAVTVKPRDQDWSQVSLGDDDNFWEAVRCEECNAIVVTTCGGEKHSDIDPSVTCKGYVPTVDGAMMNYAYPLPVDAETFDAEAAAAKIVDLPLCIYQLDGEYVLALTGGGMDLSWEICEAYIKLGFLPPLHFCGLPLMCGRGVTTRDRHIIAACLESADCAARWAENTAKHLKTLTARSKGLNEVI